MPWRGPLGGDPLAVIVGPENPWLICGSADPAQPTQPECPTTSRAPQLPDFAALQAAQQAKATRIDWCKIEVGTGMIASGLLMIVPAIVGAYAVEAALPWTATGTAAASEHAIIGSVLTSAGVVLAGAGAATVTGGVDPKITDYKKHVPAVPTRKLALPADLTPAASQVMAAAVEVERLSTAETDIIDHARAAAKARDKAWTELHLRDLYHVQHAKQHFVRALGGAVAEIATQLGHALDEHRVDAAEPVRDLVNPIIQMRATLSEVASISSAEINCLLALVRIPSPLASAMEEAVRGFAGEANGQPSQLLTLAARQLSELDVLDHGAFGEQPEVGARKVAGIG